MNWFSELQARIAKKDRELYDEVEAKLADTDINLASVLPLGRKLKPTRWTIAIPATNQSNMIRLEGTPISHEKRSQESIVAGQRPVLVIRNNQIVPEFVGPEVLVWKDRLMERQDVLNAVIPSVGRVEVNNNAVYKWVGTGWLVENDIIVTNRHVANKFCQNREGFSFKVGYPSGFQSSMIDFLEEDQRSNSLEFTVESVLWMSEDTEREPDIAFLRVKPLPNGPPLPKPIPLAKTVSEDEIVVTIGYPAKDSEFPDQDLVLRVFHNVYDKKRLAPGDITKVSEFELEHTCSTLGGNSGSAVIRLATGEAVGLHFAGLFMQSNYAVPAPKIRELLDKLKQRALPRMLIAETLTQQTSLLPLPTMSLSNSYTFEASIPIKITIEIGSLSINSQSQDLNPLKLLADPLPSVYEVALQTARQTLQGQPGILDVRLGYRFKKGWIQDERCIVVEVQAKQSLPELRSTGKQLIPGQFLGIGTDVRTAALPDQLAQLGLSIEGVEAPVQPGIYREPPGLSLTPIEERMTAIFHVSPDSGFPNLKKFIERTENNLTATMYEWEPNHISKVLHDVIRVNNRQLTMVTQKAGTQEAVKQLKSELGSQFHHVWASVGSGKIVPKAYHIKVASRDGKEIWLSSGNWKDSNQANINPAGENSTSITPLREHNREWHVIIQNERLAGLFEGYIKWDFQEAQRVPVDEEPQTVLPDIFVPENVLNVASERPLIVKYFDPLIIKDRVLNIQPLLTPDRDDRQRRIFMDVAINLIESAKQSIHIQNQSFNMLTEMDAPFERFFTIIKQKQQAGLDVRIIFRDAREFSGRKGKIDQQKLLERLKDFGLNTNAIKVQRGCHTKAIIIDSQDQNNARVLFGSHNLTNTGALYNRDASLLVKDAEVTTYYEEIFEFDWATLATQEMDETIGDVRIAKANEATPKGFRRVSLAELIGES